MDLVGKVSGGQVRVDQRVVAGCAGGTFENLWTMAEMMAESPIGSGEFALSVYPASQPINLALINQGAVTKLLPSGATLRTAFCGPCFGAGDIPANGMLSIRHTTRNFPNREGSKPRDGQLAAVALMDARSIAATAIRGGLLTAATELELPPKKTVRYHFDPKIYAHRVYHGYGQADPSVELKYGPNITDWPEMIPLPDGLILKLAAVITDPVTTTDELIPSGETSSYRSNPLKLAEFTLSRKDPDYVPKAKAFARLEAERRAWTTGQTFSPELTDLFAAVAAMTGETAEKLVADTGLGSTIFAVKPGDGSAREQAASCQKVLGGWANLAIEYATKRYRSNLINWGMLPFTIDPADQAKLIVDSYLYIPGIREAVCSGAEEVLAYLLPGGATIRLKLENLSADEREIILAGSLINYYASNR